MNYRTTRIYRRSLELVDFVSELRMPSGCGFLGDQLRRAAASVALNYLEGCGRNGAADRRGRDVATVSLTDWRLSTASDC